MASFTSVLRSVIDSVLRTTRTRVPDAAARYGRTPHGWNGTSVTPETVEVDPSQVGPVRMTYVPSTDGSPDPGEIVWTWVPYEERDGRGKDRPVLLVAAEPDGSALAVQLTSKPRGGDQDFVPIGRGQWDAEGRPSWVGLDRVFRVHPDGMRREAASLDRAGFEKVARALTARYGWR